MVWGDSANIHLALLPPMTAVLFPSSLFNSIHQPAGHVCLALWPLGSFGVWGPLCIDGPLVKQHVYLNSSKGNRKGMDASHITSIHPHAIDQSWVTRHA